MKTHATNWWESLLNLSQPQVSGPAVLAELAVPPNPPQGTTPTATAAWEHEATAEKHGRNRSLLVTKKLLVATPKWLAPRTGISTTQCGGGWFEKSGWATWVCCE